jgi:O-antigen ligase
MKTLAKLSLWVLALAPIVVTPTAFYPAVFGKMMLLRLALLVTSGALFYLFIDQPKFRLEMRGKIAAAARNPLMLSMVSFITALIISTILAVSPSQAFFGDLERAEGLLGLLGYFVFFVYSYLLFDRNDWVVFFKINVAVSIISFVKAATEFAGGSARAEAWAGNPEFLAGYFLFAIFCAVIVYMASAKRSLWQYAALGGGTASLLGVALTQTRGAFLGLGIAALGLITCGIVKGKNSKLFAGKNARTVSLALLVIIIAGGGLFMATKDASLWQKVPGISRIAKADVASANSIKTRQISLGVSIRAATHAGIVRGLFGYGPDNFNVAFNRFYDPSFYEFERNWLDRAHNKLADVAVMNGAVGLLAYLAIWLAAGYLTVWRRPTSAERLAIALFGAAYFTFLTTVFDQFTTYIPFFATLAFLLFVSATKPSLPQEITIKKKRKTKVKESGPKNPLDIITLGLMSVALLWAVAVWTFIPFAQQSGYKSMVESMNDPATTADMGSVFTPYNFAQEEMRSRFLAATTKNYRKNSAEYELFLKSIALMDEAESKEAHSPKYLLPLGLAYDQKALATKNMSDWKKAEGYYRRALVLAPQKQDIAYALAANLDYQHRSNEAVSVMQEELKADPQAAASHYYLGYTISEQGEGHYAAAMKETEIGLTYFLYNQYYPANSGATYKKFATYFFNTKDKDNFITALARLSKISPETKLYSSQIIASVSAGAWPDDIELK